MNKQLTLSLISDELAQASTRKKEFLDVMNRMIRWSEWVAMVEPCYYEGERGNKPYDLELMLRIHILQKHYDPANMAVMNEICTKNEKGECDPEAHQVKKGNQWYFGYKKHIGVDAQSGLVHTVETTAANVHDSNMASDLLQGEETDVYGDSGYIGVEKKENVVLIIAPPIKT